jgi:hypothetical protein
MGAYIYRLKGTKAFKNLHVNDKIVKVYDLVYWYKPYYHGMFESEPKWMKPIHMLGARLEKKFKEIGYPEYVRYLCEEDGSYSDVVEEWGKTISCSDEGQWYQSRKHYKWDDRFNSFCSEEFINNNLKLVTC